jgi:hypothetical protein
MLDREVVKAEMTAQAASRTDKYNQIVARRQIFYRIHCMLADTAMVMHQAHPPNQHSIPQLTGFSSLGCKLVLKPKRGQAVQLFRYS